MSFGHARVYSIEYCSVLPYSLFEVLWNSLPTPFRIISPQIIKSVSPKLENFPKFEYYSNERERIRDGEREIESMYIVILKKVFWLIWHREQQILLNVTLV